MFEGHNIRVVEIDGSPWFVAVDVCKALGIKKASFAYARVIADKKRMADRTSLGLAPGRAMTVVSESGLYDLVLDSGKPAAKAFRAWIVETVLPAIPASRSPPLAGKDGGYVLGEEKVLTGEATIEELARSAFPCGGGLRVYP
ncbi:BRO-N domain-containing protein [Amaricoccus solimangrovi]|uniref:BRO-N domain-containing protein n=1 Tax=Amaricoccus solimangrovi TaxID=2589815 RepID=UPI0015E4879E|nr:BRO family protein [Amaricoccus solimangrovi]